MNRIEQAAREANRPKGGNEMDTFPHADHPWLSGRVPTHLLAGLLMELASRPKPAAAQPERLTLKIYCVMAVTTLLTFVTLTTAYQTLFSHELFA